MKDYLTPYAYLYKEEKGQPLMQHVITPFAGGTPEVGLLGVPSDIGTVLINGRRGSRSAPEHVRQFLLRQGSFHLDSSTDLRSLRIEDFGDLKVGGGGGLEETHRRLECVVKAMLDQGTLPVIIGGSHALTYASVKGLYQHLNRTKEKEKVLPGGVNIDAHCDVRPVVEGKITSGTPFFRLLEESLIEPTQFYEVGMHSAVNAKEHLDYVEAKGAHLVPLKHFRHELIQRAFLGGLSRSSIPLFASVDIDGVAQAYAPGCSAPSSRGFTPDEVCTLAFFFGKHPNVKLIDLMEINPHLDRGFDYRTCRLGATILINFLAGFVQRRKA